MKYITYDKFYYISYLLLALVLPLSRAGIHIVVGFILIVWIIEGNFRNKFTEIFSNKILIAILSLVTVSYLSSIISTHVNFKSITGIDYKYLLFIPVSYTIIKKEWTEAIIKYFLIGMFISEIISYGIFFEFWTIKNVSPSDPTPFMNHTQYSFILVVASSILLIGILFTSNTKNRLLMILFFSTVTINLFITGGRTGQILFLFSVCFAFILYYRFSLKIIFTSLFIVLSIYYVAYYSSKTFNVRANKLLKEAEQIYNGNLHGSIGIRLSYYYLLFDYYNDNKEQLLLGVGSDGFNRAKEYAINNNIEKYKSQNMNLKKLKAYESHNQYIQIIFEMGLVGLLIYLYIIIQLMIIKYKDRHIKYIVYVFLVLFIIGSFSETMLQLQFSRTLFIIIVSLALINAKLTKS